MRELTSTKNNNSKKKKKAHAGNEWSNILPKILASEDRATTTMWLQVSSLYDHRWQRYATYLLVLLLIFFFLYERLATEWWLMGQLA